MAFCREKNQKLLFKVDSLLKFRKWFMYGPRASSLPTGVLLETTFTATFRMEQRKKQRLQQHSVWSNERNNVYGNIPYGAMKETTFTAPFRMEQ